MPVGFELAASIVVRDRDNLCRRFPINISTKIIQTGHRYLLD